MIYLIMFFQTILRVGVTKTSKSKSTPSRFEKNDLDGVLILES